MQEPEKYQGQAQALSGNAEHKPRKGIYLLPNLFTLAALFCGFYAIVKAMDGHMEAAVFGVFAAMVFDSLDGRIARMTNTQSAFGEQMDSLADMVSFGAAPALAAYAWSLSELGRWGWVAAFIYCSCAALRLARFNVSTALQDKRYFQGLPSPAAAALVMSFIWLMLHLKVGGSEIAWGCFVLTLYAGLSMVTNAPFYSFKSVDMRKSVPFVVVVGLALAFAVVSIEPPVMVFAIFMLYGLSGFVLFFDRRRRDKKGSLFSTSIDEPEEKDLHH